MRDWIIDNPFLFYGLLLVATFVLAESVLAVIPRECSSWAEGTGFTRRYSGEEYDRRFEQCLRERGLQQPEKNEATP